MRFERGDICTNRKVTAANGIQKRSSGAIEDSKKLRFCGSRGKTEVRNTATLRGVLLFRLSLIQTNRVFNCTLLPGKIHELNSSTMGGPNLEIFKVGFTRSTWSLL